VDVKKPRENPGFDGVLHLSDACEMTPTGCEQSQKTRAKTGFPDPVYPPVYPSQAVNDSGAEELMTIWAALDHGGREDLLAVARGLAAENYNTENLTQNTQNR
jgi:hypothetical protein